MGKESGDLGKRPKISLDRVTPRDFYATISSLGRGCEISSGKFLWDNGSGRHSTHDRSRYHGVGVQNG